MIFESIKGYKNSGYDNTGSLNSGDGNSGDYNQGSYNSGHKNFGDYNSGDFNFGKFNSGDFNSIDYSSGVFCTEEPEVYFFNKPSGIKLSEWRKSQAFLILSRVRTTKWIPRTNMSLSERLKYSLEYKKNGGYLKNIPFREGCLQLWNELTTDEKVVLLSLPNFDASVFKELTGIEI